MKRSTRMAGRMRSGRIGGRRVVAGAARGAFASGGLKLHGADGEPVMVRGTATGIVVAGMRRATTGKSTTSGRPKGAVRYGVAEASKLVLYDGKGNPLKGTDIISALAATGHAGLRDARAKHTAKQSARQLIAAVKAQERLVKARRVRAIVTGVTEEGMSQSEVAVLAEISQAQVSRIIKAAGADMLTPTPNEIIDERDAGEIDDAEMLARLIEIDCTYNQYPDGGNAAVDAFVPGTWNQIESAFHGGRITYEQYRLIVQAHAQELRNSSGQ
ncbi:hypothetical protein [Gordonia alkaliphila]